MDSGRVSGRVSGPQADLHQQSAAGKVGKALGKFKDKVVSLFTSKSTPTAEKADQQGQKNIGSLSTEFANNFLGEVTSKYIEKRTAWSHLPSAGAKRSGIEIGGQPRDDQMMKDLDEMQKTVEKLDFDLFLSSLNKD